MTSTHNWLIVSSIIIGLLVFSSVFVPYTLPLRTQVSNKIDVQQTEFVPSNGVTPEIQWSRMTGGAVDSSPCVADVDGDGELEVLIRSDDYYLYCLNAINGMVEWKFYLGANLYTSPSIADIDADGQLEVIMPAGTLFCIDGALGEEEWSVPGNALSSACIADVDGDNNLEIMVVDSMDQSVRCINSTGDVEWETPDLDITTYSAPTASDVDGDGELEVLCGSSNYNFYCFNGNDGSIEWNYTTSGHSSYTAAVANLDEDPIKEIVFGTNDGHVYCLNGTMGGFEWNYFVGSYPIISTPCIADSGSDGTLDVFVGTFDNYLHCIDGESGTQKWTKATSNDIYAASCAVNVDGDDVLEVFVGSHDYAMYCIDSKSGATDWYYQTAGEIDSAPYVGDLDGDGRIEIVFGSNDRNIYCLEAPTPYAPHPWTGVGSRGDPYLTGCFIDTDNDHLTDNYEIIVGLDENAADSDGDFVDDYTEFIIAADPLDGITVYPHEEWSLVVESFVPNSPLVVDVNNDGQLDLLTAFAGLLLCYDGSSMEQLWNHTYSFTMIDTIFAEDVNGDSLLEVVAVHSNVCYCYRAVDGVQLWNFTSINTLADAGCVCDTNNDGAFEIIVGSAATADPHVYCLNGSTGKQIWNFTTTGLIAPSPSAADLNHDGQIDIVFGSWDGTIYCLNASDGSELWKYTDIYRPSGYSPVIADIDLDGDLEVFVGAFDTDIHCINGVNGTREWVYSTSDYALSSATVVDVDNDGDFEAIVPSRDGNVYCLNSTGHLVWTYHTDDNIHCGASVADVDMDSELEILVTSKDNYLHCIDGESGFGEWKYPLGDFGWGIPTVVDFDGDNVLEIIVTVGWSGSYGKIFCLSLALTPEPDFYPWPGIAPLGDPTHKCRYIDTDLDFLVDEYEIAAGSDVFSSDPDTDLLSDYQEYLQSTDPMFDSVPPGAIDDIVISDVTQTSLVLNWNAPGENGDIGTVSSYIVKWSSSGPIIEENWSNATTYTQAWIPLAPNSLESHQITGLSTGQEYWFAIRALDKDGNIGAISNSPSTLVGDYVSPGKITDLTVDNIMSTSVYMTWTAPGDDGSTGIASGYILKYSTTEAISEDNWDAAMVYEQSWTPSVNGTVEYRNITGLTPNTEYWFAIVAFDEVPNYGQLSNVVALTTLDSTTTTTTSTTITTTTITTTTSISNTTGNGLQFESGLVIGIGIGAAVAVFAVGFVIFIIKKKK